MTDLHTHILPGMDDGAKTEEESLALLRMEQNQGVDTVVLTPHFYPQQESIEQFLARREDAVGRLRKAIDAEGTDAQGLPQLLVGAEVLWRSDLSDVEHLDRLCIEGTQNLLLELPFSLWSGQLINQLYDMIGQTGITPVIAHLERYLALQPKALIEEILDIGIPVQISAEVLTHPLRRGGAMKLLKSGRAHLLASDCHDCTNRPPDLAAGMEIVRRKLGESFARDLSAYADSLVCQ